MSAMDKLYELGDLKVSDVPPWIDQDITCATVAAILEGGCESGAYMPAVTYHDALVTMTARGDAVLQFIEDEYGSLDDLDLLALRDGDSWSGFACRVLSIAVELWAGAVAGSIEAA